MYHHHRTAPHHSLDWLLTPHETTGFIVSLSLLGITYNERSVFDKPFRSFRPCEVDHARPTLCTNLNHVPLSSKDDVFQLARPRRVHATSSPFGRSRTYSGESKTLVRETQISSWLQSWLSGGRQREKCMARVGCRLELCGNG
jgi:hypothetical protein